MTNEVQTQYFIWTFFSFQYLGKVIIMCTYSRHN